MRRVSLVMVAGLVLVFAMQAAPAKAWSGTVGFGPDVVYQGFDTTFTLTVTNTGGSSLDVQWITVHFCWSPSGNLYYFKANDGTSVVVPSGSSHSFTQTFLVPQGTLGNCRVDVQVGGQAVGDWWATTHDYSPVINVMEATSLMIFMLVGIIAVIAFVILIAVVLLLKRSKVGRPAQPPVQQQYAGYQYYQQPYQQPNQPPPYYQGQEPRQPPHG